MRLPEKDTRRCSIRLAGYDYSQAGYYFVTVCVNNRELLLGEIKNDCRGTVCCAPNKYGAIVCEEWKKLSQRFPNIELGEFIIMPNHIHMIIIVGAGSSRPLNVGYGNGAIGRGDRAPTLGQIMAYFKYGTTKRINELRNTGIKKFWQRNYYEHIIRDDNDLNRVREYIVNNPAKWLEDEYYLGNQEGGVTPPLRERN